MESSPSSSQSQAELPECPVCLQTYDSEYTIPRVLACGHTTCESCLSHLPQKYPLTVRCPACTQLVKYPPNGGPSSLPKNIDLLRLVTNATPKPHKQTVNDASIPDAVDQFFLPSRLWSDQLYSSWKRWVLPHKAVSVYGLVVTMTLNDGHKQSVKLVKVGSLMKDVSDGSCSDSVFKFGYWAKVLKCLNEMREEEREVLGLVLRACSNAKRCRFFCEVFGLWGDLESGHLFLVFERLNGMERFDFDGLTKDGVFRFALMGMEMCEAVINLHKEGLIAGCLGVSCFKCDEFGHVFVDLSEVLEMGRGIYESVVEASLSGRRIEDKEIRVLLSDLSKSGMFVSPEALFQVLMKKGIEVELDGSFGYSVGYGSDVWLLACLLPSLLIGKQFNEDIFECMCNVIPTSKEIGLEKVSSLFQDKFGEEFVPLHQIICQCLNLDPGSRPLVTDVWKCIREMAIMPQFDIAVKVDDGADGEESKFHCLILLELCQIQKERLGTKVIDELQGTEGAVQADLGVVEEASSGKDLVGGLSEGNVKLKEMKGHLDCITGLAVGGGFLFSSSYDKSVHVWSLEDFSHVQIFRGHEHKVMAVIFVDEEQPLCISADGGGGIFVWSTCIPLAQEPLKKWYEQKDWRYSGIHALITGGNGYIYTGSGDKTIKAWSLKDGALFCTMTGHKSTVSSLAVCNGVLYSGSWDGTIRLWTLSDHSLLTVLGEDTPGTLTPVLSIVADQQILVASHENGFLKVWKDDLLVKSTQNHSGAIFAVSMEVKWLFSGGWDKTVNVQELLNGDELQVDSIPIGSIPCDAVITALLCWQGKLVVGFADRTVKVYCYGK